MTESTNAGQDLSQALPEKVIELIERFQRNHDAYRQSVYNETQLRREFIDPFFKALGWDVDNEQGYAEPYKDVVHEDAIKLGGVTKAPDYSFRIGGVRKFFVEAKKPAINIKEDSAAAYQLRRYAWSAKLPLSILTNFEDLAVYDCRVKPQKTDKASHSRVFFVQYTDYQDRWAEVAGVFSREALLKGSFDKYAESKKAKKGTAEVDAAFLEEIERWRDLLARNIALRNPALTQRQLNFAVQVTIDRIIFLRICEDRGMEPYGALMALQNGDQVYQRLFHLFRRADDRYNSGLFHFREEKGQSSAVDSLTPTLALDDKVLKEVFKNLYYPDSPYEFSVLPADILGQVYEQFLGKVIRLTAGHQARVDYKPEVRKAGGVYYTPTYIVDYIVRQTVGQGLAGKKPGLRSPASQLKILDPACGSGSFLLGAYQYLLNWHLEAYLHIDPARWARGRNPRLYQAPGGGWKLTIAERKRILLDQIYGVDIDSQAVEVTKLSLLLKVLEGENDQSVRGQLTLNQRALPDLGQNIKCGNSLIGPDFYQGRQMTLLDDEETYRVNAFDWQREFPEIMAAGGFDVVIGNPPYGYLFDKAETIYLANNIDVFLSIPDAYVAFIAKSHDLLKNNGRFGFIIPSAWLGGPAYRKLRTYLLKFSIDAVILLPFDIFKDAYIDTVLLTTDKKTPDLSHNVLTYEYKKKEKIRSIDIANLPISIINQQSWNILDDCKFVLNANILKILSKIKENQIIVMDKFINIKRGVLFNLNLLTENKISEFSYPYFEGDVYRYSTRYFAPKWVEYGNEMVEYPKQFSWFEGERILLRRLVNRKQRLMASKIETTVITNKNLYIIKGIGQESLSYILGIINSLLISKLYLAQVSQASKDDFPQVTIKDILSLPFRTIDFNDPEDQARHDRLVAMVDNMLAWHRQLAAARTPQEKAVLERQIAATDRMINQLVYELYGLTEEEIKLVEGVNRLL